MDKGTPAWRTWTPLTISPVVSEAARTVRCLACGYAHDSEALTDLQALDEVLTQHEAAHAGALRVQWSVSSAESVSKGGVQVSDDAPSLESLSLMSPVSVTVDPPSA